MKEEIKIWHISDTHLHHHLLDIPDNIDMVIHSGDATNSLASGDNYNEMIDFLQWFSSLPIEFKIFVAGNHDSALYHKMFTQEELLEKYGIVWLEDDMTMISFNGKEPIKIFGASHMAQYGNWCYMKPPHKLERHYYKLPSEEVDILITHSPAKSRLDLTDNFNRELEQAGSKTILNYLRKVKAKYHMFGHIHNTGDIVNAGLLDLNEGVIYSNGSVVTDRRFGQVTSNGNIINYKI